MYNDDTLLTCGKYKFMSLWRVPPDYLLKIYKHKSYFNPEIKQYIENHLDEILTRKQSNVSPPPLKGRCKKKTYPSKAFAKTMLRRIQETMPKGVKRPKSAYECEKCGGWHLTSMTKRKYNQIKKNQNHANPSPNS